MSDKQLLDASYEPYKHNGKYNYESANQQASIEIRHIKANLYSINGTSFYGTDRPREPNICKLSEIGVLKK